MRVDVSVLHEPLASGQREAAAPSAVSPVNLENSELRRQIVDIILDVLSESGPVRPEVRARLLQHLSENPGHPEQALLDHLLDPDIRKTGDFL